MITIQFVAEWALRSSVLIGCGGFLLWALRIKDSSVRLLAWTAMLIGSLLIPAITATLPKAPVAVWVPGTPAIAADVPSVSFRSLPAPQSAFDWMRVALFVYFAGSAILLLRVCAGLYLSGRILHASRATGKIYEGVGIRESDRVSSPVTLGVVRSAIVLPPDWREWEAGQLEAVLAHERSHIRRGDPAVQLLSALHRALLWHSPLSWYLHSRIVRAAEEASDDAALAVASDRVTYADMLLGFMQRGVRGAGSQGVAMARYDTPETRIDRILDGTKLSRGVTRLAAAAILIAAAPVAYLAAAGQPETQILAAPAVAPAPPAPPAVPAEPSAAPPPPASPAEPPSPPAAPAPPQDQNSGAIRRYMIFSDDSNTTGSWDSRDPVDDKALRARFGKHFAWFRQAGKEYVITDSGVLAELDQAMEPQKKVNAMQERVNGLQSKVNEMQSGVNRQQNDVNSMQHLVNARQNLVNRIQAASSQQDQQALIQELEHALAELRAGQGGASQDAVNRKQAEVNQAQARVNAEQQVVNGEQQKVNEEQHRVSADFNQRMQQIFESAIKRRLVKQLI